jgi:hypothetical protein
MTKLISVLIIVAALFVGWRLFKYYEQVKDQEANAQKEAAAATAALQSLPGLPSQLEPTLEAAKKRGAAGLRDWLKAYGTQVQDPRKAWIELEYAVLVSRDNVAEARKVYAAVKERTSRSSPVWPRIEELKMFE